MQIQSHSLPKTASDKKGHFCFQFQGNKCPDLFVLIILLFLVSSGCTHSFTRVFLPLILQYDGSNEGPGQVGRVRKKWGLLCWCRSHGLWHSAGRQQLHSSGLHWNFSWWVSNTVYNNSLIMIILTPTCKALKVCGLFKIKMPFSCMSSHRETS